MDSQKFIIHRGVADRGMRGDTPPPKIHALGKLSISSLRSPKARYNLRKFPQIQDVSVPFRTCGSERVPRMSWLDLKVGELSKPKGTESFTLLRTSL